MTHLSTLFGIKKYTSRPVCQYMYNETFLLSCDLIWHLNVQTSSYCCDYVKVWKPHRMQTFFDARLTVFNHN